MGQFDDFVSRYFDPRFGGPDPYGILCWLAVNQEGGPVSYAYARDGLNYHPGVGQASPYVTGEMNQLFSDRTSTQPFDINSGDRTIVTLKPWWDPDPQSLAGGSLLAFRVQFESLTWGGRFELQDVACRANVITGYGSPIGQPPGVSEALYTVSLGTPYTLG